jgi:hypothetical protein
VERRRRRGISGANLEEKSAIFVIIGSFGVWG